VIQAPGGEWQLDNAVGTADITAAADELTELVGEVIDPWNQDQLNRWHLEFERHSQALAMAPQWIRINVVIHHIEALRRHQQYICVSRRPDIRKIIDPRLYPLWQNMPAAGDLRLGFHTIGKTINNCFVDKDIELVQQGLVQAQRDLHSQSILYLDPNLVAGSNKDKDRHIRQWLRDLDPPQDLTQGLHRYHGLPLIARAVDLPDMQKFYTALAEGDSVSHWETK
jgi:hypothetical protein